MTRASSTQEEKISGSALLEYLRDTGREIANIDRDVDDNPDLFFQLDSVKVGCECVQIPPGRVYKYIHSRFRQLSKSEACAVRIVWPQEQHCWVKDAIESKNQKIETYKQKSGADVIWLLIHSPIREKDTTVRYQKPEIMNLIKYAANKTTHNFNEIYFWDPLHGITKIYPLEKVWQQVKFNFDGGYPTDGFVMSVGKFTTTELGEEPVEIDHGIVTPEVVIVPPQDPEFKKHPPRFRNRRYRMKIITGATDAKISMEPVDD